MKGEIISLIAFCGVVLLIIGSLVMAALQPYFEAKAFNDCTGGHATYLTALFTELRVQDCSN